MSCGLVSRSDIGIELVFESCASVLALALTRSKQLSPISARRGTSIYHLQVEPTQAASNRIIAHLADAADPAFVSRLDVVLSQFTGKCLGKVSIQFR